MILPRLWKRLVHLGSEDSQKHPCGRIMRNAVIFLRALDEIILKQEIAGG